MSKKEFNALIHGQVQRLLGKKDKGPQTKRAKSSSGLCQVLLNLVILRKNKKS